MPDWSDGTLQERTFGRFCSNTLSDPGLFYNESTKNGYKGQIFFPNEEDGDIGRAFAVTKDGDAVALPRLGLFQWENTIPAPNQTDTTLVMGMEDGPAGNVSQLWVYVGSKQKSGEPVAKAGLTNGDNHVLDAVNQAVSTDTQWRATYDVGEAAPVRSSTTNGTRPAPPRTPTPCGTASASTASRTATSTRTTPTTSTS